MKEKLTDIACCARILGALFYYSPEAPEARAIVDALRMPGWEREWPCGFDSARVTGFYTLNSGDETLAQAWQRLLIGPHALPAPPWGSVWLDRESVLFGDSTLALQGWLRDNAIAFETPLNEPADHIGLLLLLGPGLRSTEKPASSMSCWPGICCPSRRAFWRCSARRRNIRFTRRWAS